MSYTSKYQKYVACIYGYKLECVDEKFSKPFKSYLGEDAAYHCISSIIEECKYCKWYDEKNILTQNLW